MQTKVLIAIIGILFTSLLISFGILDNRKEEILKYETQMEVLREESQKNIEKVEDAKKKAESELAMSEQRAARVLQIDVPKECEKAIEWAISHSRRIREA